jgi:MFS family permease
MGAFLGTFITPALIGNHGQRRAIGVSTALMGISLIALPFLGAHTSGTLHLPLAMVIALPLLIAVLVYGVMGCCRALGGVAINSSMMEQVPKHFMGRVQNTFFFAGTLLQLVLSFVVGRTAHTRGLAQGFAIVGTVYLLASAAGSWPVKVAVEPVAPQPASDSDLAPSEPSLEKDAVYFTTEARAQGEERRPE